MLCSIGHGEIPNLNFWLAPFCTYRRGLQFNNQILNHNNPTSPLSPIFTNNIIFNPILPKRTEIFVPKRAEVKIIKEDETEQKKEKNSKKIFEVCTGEICHDNLSDISTHDHEQEHYHEDANLNFITENDITKFNNDQKMKKIHSTYHLKRKVITKFQNQVKLYVNNLIMECNKSIEKKIPFLSPCTKAFREDVKIETFKKIKNCTIEKYVAEDIQSAGRSLNMNNFQIINLIKDIADKYDNNADVKKLKNFLEKNLIIDYYNEFLESNNFRACLEKDLKKYVEKLVQLNYPEEKIHMYKKIFKEKYEGIAKYLFYAE